MLEITTVSHPALETAPKNLRESLTRMVAFLKTNPNRGCCQYENDSGARCIIGSFFTPEQIKWIRFEAVANSSTVRILTHNKIGRLNLFAMTGMTIAQADVIQAQFDFQANLKLTNAEFANRLQEILDGSADRFEGIEFIL